MQPQTILIDQTRRAYHPADLIRQHRRRSLLDVRVAAIGDSDVHPRRHQLTRLHRRPHLPLVAPWIIKKIFC